MRLPCSLLRQDANITNSSENLNSKINKIIEKFIWNTHKPKLILKRKNFEKYFSPFLVHVIVDRIISYLISHCDHLNKRTGPEMCSEKKGSHLSDHLSASLAINFTQNLKRLVRPVRYYRLKIRK